MQKVALLTFNIFVFEPYVAKLHTALAFAEGVSEQKLDNVMQLSACSASVTLVGNVSET